MESQSSSLYLDSIEGQDSLEKTNNHITFSNGVQEGPTNGYDKLGHSGNGYEKGGMPLISDSLFSLVILIYVSVVFLFVFFMFCWRNGSGTMDSKGTNEKLACPLMSLEDIIGGKKQQDKPQDKESIMMNILNDIDDEFNARQVKIRKYCLCSIISNVDLNVMERINVRAYFTFQWYRKGTNNYTTNSHSVLASSNQQVTMC